MMKTLLIVVLLTLLCTVNMFLLFALTYSSREQKNTATKLGFGFMGAVLVLNTLFSIGGVILW